MKPKDKLLVIDDQKIVRDSLAKILRKAGYNCQTAASAHDGRECLKKEEFSLVLTDLRLGDGDGLEIIEYIKKYHPQTLVILLTAYASLDSSISALRRGAYDYLIKPCNVEDLKHTVARSLDKRRQSMENERLRFELEQAYFLTVKALAAAIDAKDKYTCGHSDRVMQYTMGIAQEVTRKLKSLTIKDINDIQYAALIHDIGKIGIRDNILTKPGKLTNKEYSIVKLHPVVGYEILNEVHYLNNVKHIVRHHHEWYNGTGYPDGLKGEDIPMGAQIICVADAYDAMTSTRPYRRMMSHQEALDELNRFSGKQFSPNIVDAFMKVYHKQPHIVESTHLPPGLLPA